MLPETLVTLICTLDQSGTFSWPAARPQESNAANEAIPAQLRSLKFMEFLQLMARILALERRIPPSNLERAQMTAKMCPNFGHKELNVQTRLVNSHNCRRDGNDSATSNNKMHPCARPAAVN